MIALVVSLRVRPQMRERFLAVIQDTARSAVAGEPGCIALDVYEDYAEANHFVLNEVYRDDAALAGHRATSHYRRWRENGIPCVVEGSLTITTSQVLVRPSKPKGDDGA